MSYFKVEKLSWMFQKTLVGSFVGVEDRVQKSVTKVVQEVGLGRGHGITRDGKVGKRNTITTNKTLLTGRSRGKRRIFEGQKVLSVV